MDGAKLIECPRCHQSSAEGATRCSSCGAVLAQDATITHAGVETNWSRATRIESAGLEPGMSLDEGSVIADRYEILKLLGEGGMGAVYKARDRELDRLVALKVIRPELAGHPTVLARFKQELILARKVTHRNVIRIFDLGVADGLRFITMEFVQGRDLSALLEEHKYSPEETVKILRQVCSALEVAHSEGVVHRDLKPQNIMVEDSGRACVMDFGLARSMEATGLTQVGAVMGTPAYMSPEQAKGMPADERSDIFSLGIIAYQMLTGVVPFKADTALASMLLRTQGPPAMPNSIDPSIPEGLNNIVMKMVQPELTLRYQSVKEISADLQAWQDGVLGLTMIAQPIQLPVQPSAAVHAAAVKSGNRKRWFAIAAVGIIAITGAVFNVMRYFEKPAAPTAPVTVMIADFENHTGDPVFSGTLESTLKLALEGASFINAYDRTRMRDLGLPAFTGAFNLSAAQNVAVNQGLNAVVVGSVDKNGAAYQLSLRAIQAVTGKVLANVDASASSKDQVLFAVSKLAGQVRKALGDATSESAQRFSMETLTAASLEAVHEYSIALDALSNGKNDDALKHFSQAADLDQNFGLAYAGMASAAHNLGRQQDAEKDIKQAISHIDHMTERERYRTRAFLYLLVGDEQKCVDEYGTLLTKYPSDTGAYNNEAVCLTQLRNLPKALEQVKHAEAILPKRATYHVNISFYSSYASDFATAAKEADASLALNPSYGAGMLAKAFAALGQEQTAQAAEFYTKLQALRPSEAAAGLADLAIYEGRYSDAVKMLEQGASDDLAAHHPDAAADKYTALAYTQLQRGQKDAAVRAAQNALQNSTAFKVRFLAAGIFVEAGNAKKAREIATSLASELPAEPQVYAKLIEGEAELKEGSFRPAIKSFTDANTMLDTWIGRFYLGRAYLESGAFTEADSELDRCMKRRGEALALFLDEVPTYGYLPPLYYYQGRVREGLKSASFGESYKKYVSIRGKAGEDPLLADARKRAGQ
jgi:tetratricopeptide (TPR) repeat protein/predicted Ser/Thr protein kinase